jgi:hypothetical protein
MPRKSYRTFKLCIALHRIIVRERAVLEQTEKKKKAKRDTCRIFLFSCDWVRHKVYPPASERGGWESESLRVFNTRQESGNGTRELRTGS